MKSILLPLFALLGLAAASAAPAETFTLTIDNPPVNTAFEVDFDCVFTGITNVNVAATGYATAKNIHCESIGGSETVQVPWLLNVDLAADFNALVELPMFSDFDVQADAYSPTAADWSDLEDGRMEVHIDYIYYFEIGFPTCMGIISPPGTLDQLILTVTCETVVPAVKDTWGAVKALYR